MHLTVTMPAYRHEAFIGAAIESVLAQDHDDFDLLVLDDRSPDASFEIARRYERDPRVRCIQHPENLGLVRNWNRALELARGPLVMVMASDDLLDPHYLRVASDLFEANPSVGLVHAPVRSVNAANEVVNEPEPRPLRRLAAGDEAVASLLLGGISTVTTVVRRSAYESVGPYDREILNTPDIEFTARIARHYDVIDVGEVHGTFRWHGGKWGHLSFLQPGTLEGWMAADRKTWGHLSAAGIAALGHADLESLLRRHGASYALDGALSSVAHGRPDLARQYLRRAGELEPKARWQRRAWQARALLALGPLGARIAYRRMTGGGDA